LVLGDNDKGLSQPQPVAGHSVLGDNDKGLSQPQPVASHSVLMFWIKALFGFLSFFA